MKTKPPSKDTLKGYMLATKLELSTNAKWPKWCLSARGHVTRSMFGKKRR